MGIQTPIRILVADTEAHIRDTLSKALRVYGYDVETVATSDLVVHTLASRPVDVLLLELLPQDAGMQVLDQIRRTYPKLIIIGLVVQGTGELAREALRVGAQDFLLKPTLARDLSVVIERNLERMRFGLAMRAEHTEDLLFQTVQALTTAIEAKDPYTAGHSQKVARLAAHFGLVLQLSPADVFVLRLGGLLHDIGKIGIPESILLKPGPLNQHEWEIMKQHPAIGASIVGQIAGLDHVAEVVAAHHERWDGQGYPHGYMADDIPMLARMLYIVDAYDAITSDRAYRKAARHEEAVAVIRQQAGIQFDRDLARVFEEQVLPTFAHSALSHQTVHTTVPGAEPSIPVLLQQEIMRG